MLLKSRSVTSVKRYALHGFHNFADTVSNPVFVLGCLTEAIEIKDTNGNRYVTNVLPSGTCTQEAMNNGLFCLNWDRVVTFIVTKGRYNKKIFPSYIAGSSTQTF